MKSRHYKFDGAEFDQRMSQIKNEDAALQPSAELQTRLVSALRAARPEKSRRTYWLSAAAVFVVSVFCGSLWILKPELRPNLRPESNLNNIESTDGYVPLTYGLTPEETLQRVRVRLPRSALNDFGISVTKTRSDEVTADVLVGESGLPYAIRVVNQN